MKTEFVTLPREVVEQALEALSNTGTQRGKQPSQFLAEGLSINALRAALEQPQIQTGGIPPNWKLVPVEPTDDMLYDIQEFSHILPPRGKRIWAHMLAAAPQPPTTEQSSAVQPQGEQKPVAWMYDVDDEDEPRLHLYEPLPANNVGRITPLYTHPQPKREPLTQERKLELVGSYFAETWAQVAALGLLHDFERAHEIGVRHEPQTTK